MDEKSLLKQFNANADLAFLEVIRSAPGPIDARRIMASLTDAGARLATVRDKWGKSQKFINLHPYVAKPKSTQYEWRLEPIPSSEALRRLSSNVLKSVPSWLTNAYVTLISDSLAFAETSGSVAQSTWSDERELQKAQLLADMAAEAEIRVEQGASAADLVKWLQTEAMARHLQPTARLGERVPFAPEEHDAEGATPRRGATVEVLRSGFKWKHGTREDTVVRAVVRAT